MRHLPSSLFRKERIMAIFAPPPGGVRAAAACSRRTIPGRNAGSQGSVLHFARPAGFAQGEKSHERQELAQKAPPVNSGTDRDVDIRRTMVDRPKERTWEVTARGDDAAEGATGKDGDDLFRGQQRRPENGSPHLFPGRSKEASSQRHSRYRRLRLGQIPAFRRPAQTEVRCLEK